MRHRQGRCRATKNVLRTWRPRCCIGAARSTVPRPCSESRTALVPEEPVANCFSYIDRRGPGMKHLVSSIAITAALVIAAPVWAQNANPSGGNGMGMPGPNPGGGGLLTPYSGGAPGPAANSAMPPPPSHHHAVRHARAMHAHHKEMAARAALSGDTTAQLNREELARIQSGNMSNPPAPGGAAPMGGPEGPAGGGNMGMPGGAPGGGMPPNEGAPPPPPYSPGAGGPPPH